MGSELPAYRYVLPLRRLASVLVVIAVAMLSAGCQQCDAKGTQPGYLIYVQDGSGAPICDASVTLDSIPVQPTSTCLYTVRIPTREASASLHVERDGYLPVDRELSTEFSSDACGHPYVVRVTVILQKG